MLAQDVAPPRVIMEVLGHSQISITMNTYSHISEAQSRDAAKRIGEARASRWTSLLAVMLGMR
jgi:integrase